jgi:hypothetical protein
VGETSQPVPIEILGELIVEPDETIDLSLTNFVGTGQAGSTQPTATLELTNDDVSDVSLTVSPASVAEDGVDNLEFTFSRTNSSAETPPLTVDFDVAGTAAYVADYTQSGAASFHFASGTVTFAEGDATATVVVDPVPDASFGADETVELSLTAGGGYNVVAPSSATGTITNDDTAGDYVVDDGDPGYSETGSGWTGQTGISDAYDGDLRWHLPDSGSSFAKWEITGITPGQYEILATWQEYSNRATDAPYAIYDGAEQRAVVRVDQQIAPTTDELLGGQPFQSLGTFNITGTAASVTLSNDADGRVLADAVHFVHVGEVQPRLSVSISSDRISEQGGTTTATVTRSTGTSGDLVVDLASSDTGEATVPASVTIGDGQDSATFTITGVDDTELDGFQSVTITATAVNFEDGTDTLEVSDDEVIDDGDAGYSESGSGWGGASGTVAAFDSDVRWHAGGTGANAATWQVTNLTPGEYQVLATWLESANRATNAPFTVYDGSTVDGVLSVNQQNPPTADATLGGRPFEILGTFNISSTSMSVTLSDDANGYVVADAIQFIRAGDLANELTVELAAGAATEGDGAVSATVTRTNVTGQPLVVTLSSSDPTEATVDASVEIPANEASVTFDVTPVDDDEADGTQTATITATADGFYSGSDTLSVADNDVVDDGDTPGYSETGTGWSGLSTEGYNGDYRYAVAGSGGNTASWEVTGISSGRYEVLVTWVSNSNRATNAPFTLYDAAAVEETFAINQRMTPTDDATLGGRPFQSLGTFNINGTSAKLTLSDDADGVVIADAVQFVRLGDLGNELTLTISADEVAEGSSAVNATVTRSEVTDQPLTVTLSSDDTSEATVPGTVTIQANDASADFDVTIVDDTEVDGTQTVTVTASATGAYSDTDTLDVLDNDATVIDDGETGYTESGTGWNGLATGGYNGDYRYNAANSGSSQATWEFTGLLTGLYEVRATWVSYGNRATNAPYTILDGATTEDTVTVNQQAAPTADGTLGGRPFQSLGSYNIDNGSLSVQLSDDADGYVIADAIQILRLGDLSNELTVTIAVSEASEGGGTVSATVSRSIVTSSPLTVDLSSSDTSEATVPATATIDGGQASKTFDITLQDDTEKNGPQVVTITASASGTFSGSDTLTVLDNDATIVDDGDSGHTAAGSWSSYSGQGYANDVQASAAGSGADTATWEVTGIASGQYEVFATWTAYSNRATNAPYAIYDGTTAEGTVTVDQQSSPTADSTVGGRPFQSLGTFNINSASMKVTLSDAADGYVIADAIQFERVGDVLGNQLSVSVSVSEVSEGFGGTFSATVTRSNVDASSLTVNLSSSDETEATVPTTVTIDPNQASATFDITIEDDDIADGTQTVTITATEADSAPGSDTLDVTDDEVVDNGDTPGYSEGGTGWATISRSYLAAYEQDYRYHAAGSGGNTATWERTDITPGNYEVLVTWLNASNRATNAPFTVYDGSTSESTFTLDQTAAPTADITLGGRPFQSLGVFSIADTSVSVTLSDNANGYVIADAALFVPASPLRAAEGAVPGTGDVLTVNEAETLLVEAASRWQAAGFDTASLSNVRVVVADLSGDLLGLASAASNTIWLDADAAGYGWFVDATPWDDDEFGDQPAAEAAGRMDALSVLFHELGHLLGQSDVDALLDPEDPMADLLSAGIRRAGEEGHAHDAALHELLNESV